MPLTYGIRRRQRGGRGAKREHGGKQVVGTWPKPATSKLSFMLVRSVKGSDRIGSSAGGSGRRGRRAVRRRPVVHRRVGRRGRGGRHPSLRVAAGCGPTIVD